MSELEQEPNIDDVIEAFTEVVAKIVQRFEVLEARLNKLEGVTNEGSDS